MRYIKTYLYLYLYIYGMDCHKFASTKKCTKYFYYLYTILLNNYMTFWVIIYIYIGECVCVCLSVCLSVCVSFRRYTRRRLCSDRDQILHTHADSSPNGSEQNKNQPRVTQGGFGGGFRGSEIHKSGITTKRVDQLAPNLVHACGFIWECT